MTRECSVPVAWFEYLAARALAGLLALIPLSAAVALGRGLGALFFHVDRRHRNRCIAQIRAALDVGEPEARRIARAMYRHLGTMLAEVPRLGKLTARDVDALVDWGEGPARIRELLAQGKGLILFTGHVGNWEVCGAAFALKGFAKGAVARPLDNPLIDRWLRGLRQASGQEIWDKFGAMRRALRALREGHGFGILVDQDGGQDGVFARFFGRTASTMPAAADLAMRTRAPLMAACFQRLGPMRFRLEVSDPFRADPAAADPAAERLRLVQRINDELERIIRKAPEQWLWLHRRWKTQPKPAARAPGASAGEA